MQNLDPPDADWLGRITKMSWEPVVAQLEALNRSHKDSSITRRLLSRVRCFADALRPFFGCMDMVFSSGGSIIGVVWGALRLVIEVSQKAYLLHMYKQLKNKLFRLPTSSLSIFQS
jgi:hypothetical protein